MRNSTKSGLFALLLILTLSAGAYALSFRTTYNPFTGKLDYYTVYDDTDNATVACLNLSGSQRCTWPVGGAADFTWNPPLYNISSGIYFNGSAANVNGSSYWDNYDSPNGWDLNESDDLYKNGTRQLTSNWNAGNWNITATTFIGNLNASVVTLTEITAPGTPPADSTFIYAVDQSGNTRLEIAFPDGSLVNPVRDNILIARNVQGTAITKGQAVYVNGSTGNTPNVRLAKADDLVTAVAIGLVYEASISDNGFGRIMYSGRLSNFDTSMWNEGDRLYLSGDTLGGMNTTEPEYPYYVQMIGTVLNSGVGNGAVLVAPYVIELCYTETIDDYIIVTNGSILSFNVSKIAEMNVNRSNYWDGYDTANATQFENDGGLHMIESWITSFLNTWLGAKTTDNLVQGSANLYDNKSWNETRGSLLYRPISAEINWSNLTGYPSACAAGSAVTTLADAVLCSAFQTGSELWNTTEEMQDAIGGAFDATLNYTDAADKMGINRTWLSSSGSCNTSSYWDNYGTPNGWDLNESDDLYVNGTRALTANWDVGAFNLTADGFKLGTNERIYMGASDNSRIYFNGTCLRMEVGATIDAVCP